MRDFRFRLGLTALATSFLLGCQTAPLLRSVQGPPLIRAQNNQTAQGTEIIDDSEIAGGFQIQDVSRLEQEDLLKSGEQKLFATQTRPATGPARSNALSGRLVFQDRAGQTQPGALATASLYQGSRKVASALTDSNGSWQLPLPASGRYQVRYTLENPRWQISNYSWEGPSVEVSGPADVGETTLIPGSQNAEAAWIHEVYLKSLALFEREQVPLDWWRNQIRTYWPVQGNYYTNYTVNLSGAEQWDVNGHEVGHAIYHQALNARSRGGQHKIDDCYNGTLALSEGFASFFSAAVFLQKSDPDAHFDKYLVPRRAPIRIENVPDDVCPGSTNEWRVSSVFWDVYDSNPDKGEQMSVGLRTIFEALGRRERPAASSALDAYGLLKEVLPAESHAQLSQVFKQNTMEIQ